MASDTILSIVEGAGAPIDGDPALDALDGETAAETEPPVDSPADSPIDRLARELARRFAERSYATAYLARRCRTTPRAVDDWRRGSAIPDRAEWSYLGQVSRDFRELDELWHEAWQFAQDASGFPGEPSRVTPAVLEGPPIPVESPAPPAVAARTSASGARLAGDPPAIPVSGGLLVFRCRISRGRVLEIPLPIDLSRADVDRICAFLRTQADPEEPPK